MDTTRKLTLRNERECKCIILEYLLYVCVNDYLSTFYCEDNVRFTCTMSLLEVEIVLPSNFFRINRNCIVNIYAIDTIYLQKRTILLSNSDIFIVSQRKMGQLQEVLTSCNDTLTS